MIERWLEALADTPGLTSVSPEDARRVHVEESLAALGVVRQFEGPIIDVGSGGGAPGIPLAASLPERGGGYDARPGRVNGPWVYLNHGIPVIPAGP